MTFRVTRRDALRGSIAGTQGHAVRCASLALFEAGGRAVLPARLQSAVRVAAEGEASRVLAGLGLLETGGASAVPIFEGGAARVAAGQTARAAGRQVLRNVGAAAGAGALVDGGWALFHAVRAVRRGSMSKREAAAHVAREAATGAAATAAGATAAVLLVALTGGVGAPAVFLVGAAASVGAKAGLDRWIHARAEGDLRLRAESAPSA